MVEFEDGKDGEFDIIIFATGYNSTVLNWLKVHIKQSHNCFSLNKFKCWFLNVSEIGPNWFFCNLLKHRITKDCSMVMECLNQVFQITGREKMVSTALDFQEGD